MIAVIAGAVAAGGCGFGSSNGSSPPDAATPVPDAAPDATPAPGCFGADGLPVCVDSSPPGTMVLAGRLDTDLSDQCLPTQPASWFAQPAACFVMADTISIRELAVIGHRPLVVFARSHLVLDGRLDAASHRSQAGVMVRGPGSPSMECNGYGRDPENGPGGGGGAGGSFMSPGGDGGTGDVTNHGGGLPDEAMVGAPGRLRGGCPGQVAAGGGIDDGGAAGGAVYLVSGGDIAINGTINVSGSGGAGGTGENGGSGGGSGGMIVLSGASLTIAPTSVLLALGGGGGGGASSTGLPATGTGASGSDPQPALPTAAAVGGGGGAHTGTADGGDGGSGGSGFPATSPKLDGASGEDGGGGGGGGGGAGYIQCNQSLGMATVLPAPVITN